MHIIWHARYEYILKFIFFVEKCMYIALFSNTAKGHLFWTLYIYEGKLHSFFILHVYIYTLYILSTCLLK